MQPEKVDSPTQLLWIGEAEPLSRHRQSWGETSVLMQHDKAGEVSLSWTNIGQFNLYNGEVLIADLNGKREVKFPVLNIPNFKMLCRLVQGAREHVAAQDK